MRVHNLLLLFHLPTRCTKGGKSLIDYSQSHVVTSFKYFDIIRRIITEKAVAKEIKVDKKKIRNIRKLNE
jgi:hypothetical protein